MFNFFLLILKQDIRLVLCRRSEILIPVFFFVLVVTLFPLGISPELKILRLIGAGIFWVAALLASMLALERLFTIDYDDGTLEQYLLAPTPLFIIILAKISVHWLITGLPLVLISPILAIQYGLSSQVIFTLVLSLLLGTPILSLIGAIGAALTLGLRGGGILISLLILPLCIPVLIFGSGAVEAARTGLDASGHFYLLSAILLISLILSPIACALSIRISVE